MDSFAVDQLHAAGLLAFRADGYLVLRFSNEFFTKDEADQFAAYTAAVKAHEDALERFRRENEVDPVTVNVLDRKRSRLHNGLAQSLQQRLPIPSWDHEQYRRWIAAMVRHELPGLGNKALAPIGPVLDALARLPGVQPDTDGL